MIRLEVWGETPEQFTENAMKAWGLLAIGLQQALSVQPVSSPSSAAALSQSKVETSGSENSSTASSPKMSTSTTSVKSGQKATVHSDPVDDLFVETPSTQPTGNTETKPATLKSSKSVKGPKLDDLKTRLSEVIVAATERWDQKRANAHARKLLEEFEVAKLSDLASDRYGEFMARTADYLDGTAAE